MNANITARNANITRFANNASIKGDKIMSAFTNTANKSFARSMASARKAVAMFALGGALTLATTIARADLKIASFVSPNQDLFAAIGSTVVEVKVTNPDNYTVSGVVINSNGTAPASRNE